MTDSNVAWATLAAAVAVSALLTVRSSNGPGTFSQLCEQQFRLNSTRAARHQTLPAGTYLVQPIGTAGAILVSDRKGNTASILTHAGQNRRSRPAESALVFKVYGENSYFLGEVRWSGYTISRTVPKSRMELDMATAVHDKPAEEPVAAR